MSVNDDVIVLTTADGRDIRYNNLAGIRHKGDYYAVLEPIDHIDGVDPGELLLFKVVPAGNGDYNYSIVLDDKILDAVWKKYQRLIKQSRGEGRALGNPKNMLLDLGVFVVLFAMLAFLSEFAGGVEDFGAIIMLLGMITNAIYFVIHLGAFIIGKR